MIVAVCIFAIFLSNVPSQSPGGIATYDIKLSEDYLTFESVLKFNNTSSLFTYKSKNEDKWLKIQDGGIGSQVVYTDTLGHLVWTDFRQENMLIRTFCNIREPLVYEDNVKFNWIIGDEEKKIGQLNCRMAKTTFRGREYTAWFAPSIPTPAGPWKFHGLPGLIVKIEDTKREVKINLKAFQETDNMEVSEKLPGTRVTLNQYHDLADIAWEDAWHHNNAIIANLQAQYPEAEISNNGAPKVRPATEIMNER